MMSEEKCFANSKNNTCILLRQPNGRIVRTDESVCKNCVFFKTKKRYLDDRKMYKKTEMSFRLSKGGLDDLSYLKFLKELKDGKNEKIN